jgi:cysteine synthase B
MVRLQRLTGLNPTNKIFIKLEGSNPGGSAKDRPALAMLNAAEASGRLTPGGHVIECTTGNTGIALASWCAARGYKLTIIMPESMTEERKVAISAYGAEIRLVPSLEEGRELARRMADAGDVSSSSSGSGSGSGSGRQMLSWQIVYLIDA